MYNLGTHLMLAAIGVVGITAQAMTASQEPARPMQAVERSAITMPSMQAMHHQVDDLPILRLDDH